ncbi:MAG: hypothetical protein R2812_01975 [Gelidibacter sp.]
MLKDQDKKDSEFLIRKINEAKTNGELTSNKPIIVVDGKPKRYHFELKENKLDFYKSDIKKIDILKNDVGIRIYGEFAKKGVVVITTKNLDKEAETSLTSLVKNKNVLIFLDGNEATNDDIQKVDPNDVDTVEVLKKEAAKKLFPDKDLDGLIYIKTKKPFLKANILFLVDNKETDKDQVMSIDPKDIQSLTVIKDKEAMKKYTQKEYDGIVVIEMKNN